MKVFITTLCLAVLGLTLIACTPTSLFPETHEDLVEREAEIQRDITLQEVHRYFSRLQRLNAQITTANADICPENLIRPFYGFHHKSLKIVDKDFQEAYERIHGLYNQTTIYHVVEGMPADGILQNGDQLLEIDDQRVPSGRKGFKAAFGYLYDTDRLDQTTKFLIERDNQKMTVTVEPVKACGGIALFSNTPEVNASANGEITTYHRGIIDEAQSDEELALIIGHEIAHNSRKHIEAGTINYMIGTIIGVLVTYATDANVVDLGAAIGANAFSESFEFEADYVGLYHTARAGFEIENAPYFWRRAGIRNPEAIDMEGESHPSNAKRFLALEEAVREIKAKQAAGLPLIPEERVLQQYEDPDHKHDHNQ